jgi:hypothetical protein
MMATLQNFKKTRIRHQSSIFGKEPRYHVKKLLLWQMTAGGLAVLGGSSVISLLRIGIGHWLPPTP